MSVTARLFDKTQSAPRPLVATIELTVRCPLRCAHCYVNRDKPERLTLAVLARLFDELASLGGLFLTLTGGEVALRPDLYEVIGEARRRHFSVSLLSSGTLFGPREWDELAAAGIDAVRLSVYARDPAVHDRVTGSPGSLALTLATARGLAARGIDVGLSCPLLTSNAAHLGEVLDLGAELGASVFFDPVIARTDAGGDGPAAWRLEEAALAQVFAEPRVRAALAGALVPQPADLSPADPPCLVGRGSTFIDAAGRVFPCASWPAAAGSIVEQSFCDIWRNGAALELARQVRNRDLLGCSACAARRRCSPCPALNLQEGGDLATPAEVVCRRTRALCS